MTGSDIRSIDLNADVGELPADSAVVPHVTSANVACGGHAGDRSTMAAAVAAAIAAGVVVGAHPGYPDRDGFGRRELGWEPERIAETVLDQVAALVELTEAAGSSVRYVKLHGALYHRAGTDHECAAAVVEALAASGLAVRTVLAEPGAAIATVASAAGWRTATEGFCDRAYRADGHLAERGEPGAVLEEPDAAVAQAVSLAVHGRARATDGSVVRLRPDSLCLHGDAPQAVAAAVAVRRALGEAGVQLRPFALGPEPG